LVDRLKKAFVEKHLEKTIRFYKSLDLLIIDELGYLPLDTEGAKLFFEVVSQKYVRCPPKTGQVIIFILRGGMRKWEGTGSTHQNSRQR